MRTKIEIIEYLRATIEEATFGRVKAIDIALDSRLLGEVGLDSLDYATVMLACEQWSGIKIREDMVHWGQVDTLAKLADLFVTHASL